VDTRSRSHCQKYHKCGGNGATVMKVAGDEETAKGEQRRKSVKMSVVNNEWWSKHKSRAESCEDDKGIRNEA